MDENRNKEIPLQICIRTSITEVLDNGIPYTGTRILGHTIKCNSYREAVEIRESLETFVKMVLKVKKDTEDE